MLLAVAGLSSAAMAQSTGYKNVPSEKYSVFTNTFWDNWFVSAGVGAEMLLGNGDAHNSIGDRISPTFNASVGKWFTPGLGLRLQYSGYEGKGARKGFGSFAKGTPDAAGYYDQKFHYMNLHGDVLFNLSAMIAGYNPDRVYEVIPYLGAGFTHSYSGVNKSQALAVNAGIINKFRVSPVLDINLELSGMMVEGKFDREPGGKHDFDGVVAATAGLTYHFKTRGFEKAIVAKDLISEAELRDMRNRMNDLAAENQSLKDQLSRKPEVVAETVVKNVGDVTPYAVFFEIGSSVVSPREKVNIGILADYMKKYPEVKVQLFGYADNATGSVALNDRLSAQRAQAVAKVLTDEFGISSSRIATEGQGGVDKYEKVYLNRKVQIEQVR